MLARTKQNTMQRAMRTALEWPQSHVTGNGQYKNTGGLKPVLWDPNLALSFCYKSRQRDSALCWTAHSFIYLFIFQMDQYLHVVIVQLSVLLPDFRILHSL